MQLGMSRRRQARVEGPGRDKSQVLDGFCIMDEKHAEGVMSFDPASRLSDLAAGGFTAHDISSLTKHCITH